VSAVRLYPIDHPEHLAASDVLPWFVNGTLDAAEAAQVERHLASCIACKQEVGVLRELQELYREEKIRCHFAAAAQAAANVPASRRVPTPSSIARVKGAWRTGSPLQWWQTLLLVQTGLIALLVAGLVMYQPPQYYRTLSATRTGTAQAASLVVVFDGAIAERDLRAVLRDLDARIVDGPTAQGAYTLTVPPAQQVQALARLRRLPSVRFAEPGP
jgi:anti-sigma factor RsiW